MAMILNAFVGKFVESVADFVQEKVSTVLGVKGELKSLQNTLENIEAVLQDAERRRIQDKAVQKWLKDLKDVMYDADDILDRCRYEGGRLLQDDPSSSLTSPLFSHEIGTSIKELNERLEKIHEAKEKFTFKLEQSKRLCVVNLRQTTPVEEDGVVGSHIKEATDLLVKLIVGEEEQKCRVFAIVGMGGIGKTTLAQKLFNEPRIQSSFPEQRQRVWVCISQSFSETDLLKEMIRGVGGHHGDAQSKAELVQIFMKQVTGSRIFLVLDDVWAADVWDDLLRIPLQREPASCRILVTTRKEEVAKRMGAVYVHRVEKLTVESGWEMLCRKVFINGEEEEDTIQSLEDIGIKIVQQCDGLPLAIKTMAGVLSGKERTSGEWEKVVRSNAWSISGLPDGVGEALYLSYDDLPSYLKQCFLYLSLFPEDYLYTVKEILRLWIAEGLVESHGGNSLEDTAEEYYEELIRRSLLHRWNKSCFKMHDLLRTLACFLSGKECFCGNVKSINNSITSQARRLYIQNSKDGEVLTPESIIPSKHLRTLFLPSSGYSPTPTVENGLISIFRLGGLRVLHLFGNRINHIPDSIGDLIHLRYLNLDRTHVSKLPESLGRLTNLRYLLLNSSKISELPDSLVRLTNLRQLSMDDTPLKHVPKGIGKLQQLNYLSGVVMGSDNVGKPQQGFDLEDLQYLSQLKFLDIRNLERASTGMLLVLQNKSYLTSLALSVSRFIGGDGQQPYVNIGKILNELVPPACLESLKLDGGLCCNNPSWMSTSFLGTLLPRLSDIELNCMACPQVPPLGELPQLKSIEIRAAREVVTIGSEFMGAGVRKGMHKLTTVFPKLESIEFMFMSKLEEWSLGGETAEERAGEGRIENQSMILFPLLKKLKIYRCPNLRALPISVFPALKSLYVSGCPVLKVVGSHNVLQELILEYDDEKMECLPEWLIKLLQQRLQAVDSYFKLYLDCHVGLFRKCLMDGPYWPIIQRIPHVVVNYYSKYMRYTKVPFSYTTNF